MPGVVILEKGTTNGTLSGEAGRYSLTLSGKGTEIEFRMVGIKTITKEVPAGDSLDVAMEEDNLQLDEVVITALGIPREKKALGYSVQTVGGDALSNSGETNMISALSGKIAGVQVTNSSGTPGSSAFIKIRGSSSITGNNQPLMVVDGVPLDNSQVYSGNPDDGNNNLLDGVNYSNRAIDINPDDIAEVTVLKGPAATALYGIQAANGVILITTKRGNTAIGGKGVNVSYSTSLSFDQVNRYVPLQNKYSQGTGGNYLAPSSNNRNAWGALIDTLYWNGDANAMWDQNGDIVGASDPTAVTKVTPYDNQESFFKTATNWDQTIALSGGNQNTAYRFSIGKLKQNGVIPLSDFGRTTVKFSGDSQLSNRLKAATSVSYVSSGGSRVQQGNNISGIMLGLLRTPSTFDNSNGSEDVSNLSSYEFADGSQRSYRNGIYDNPYWTINKNKFNDNVNRLYGFTSLNYAATDWLNVFYRLGTDTYTDSREQTFALSSATRPAGQVYLDKHNYKHINSDLWVTLNKKLTEDINGTLILGNNMYDESYNRLYSQGDGFNFPGFTQISNAQSVLVRQSGYKLRRTAMFFDAKIDYKSWAYLEVTGRKEWSSTLPSNKRSFLYPSVNLGWVVTEMLKMDNNKILPYGKLRVSYSKVGKDAGVYELITYYNASTFADGWTGGVSFPVDGVGGYSKGDQLGNSGIKPEKTTSFEIGADLKFLNNRLGLDVTYYSSNSKDQIFSVQIPASSGYLEQIINAGEITNQGIEIMLTASPIKSKNFKWDMMVNFSRNKNMVVALAPGIENIFLGGFEGSAIRAVAGQPYGAIYGGAWVRDADDNVVIENDSNSAYFGYPIMALSEKQIGNPNPDFLMGFRNTFSYKRLSLSVLLDWRQGGDIWNGTRGALTTLGMAGATETRGETTVFEGVLGTVSADGNVISTTTPNTTEVTLDQAWYATTGGGFGGPAEQFIEDGSFLKLREVSLFYQLKPQWLAKTFLQGIEVGFTARNFLLLTKYKGVDPETSLMGSFNAQGLDYFNMPSTHSYIFNLKVNL